MLNYIIWDPSDTALRIGHFALHWYSLCWLIGLLLAYLLVRRLYREQKIKDELFDPLFIYCFIGILAGARLGHCLFYQPTCSSLHGNILLRSSFLLSFSTTEDGNLRATADWHHTVAHWAS